MSTLTAYAESVLPKARTVRGRTLRPLSIGHALLLHRLGSPFMRGGPIGIGDMLLAVEVCSRPFVGACRFVAGRWTPLSLRVRGYWAAIVRQGRAVEQTRQMAAYVAESLQWPAFHVEHKGDGKSGASWLNSLKVHLMRMGVPREEVFDYPLAEAVWDFLASKEGEGVLTIEDPEAVDALVEAATRFRSERQAERARKAKEAGNG